MFDDDNFLENLDVENQELHVSIDLAHALKVLSTNPEFRTIVLDGYIKQLVSLSNTSIVSRRGVKLRNVHLQRIIKLLMILQGSKDYDY